ncbi:unnamed protein product [Prunus brigantina]
MKLELSSVFKRATDRSYPNATDVFATGTSVENDLGCVLGELNSFGYPTSLSVEGSSHTTASPPPNAVTPPPAAVIWWGTGCGVRTALNGEGRGIPK